MIDKILATWGALLLPILIYGSFEIEKNWPERRWIILSIWAICLFPLILMKIWF